MKINVAANSTSSQVNRDFVKNLIKEFCDDHGISFRDGCSIYYYLMRDGAHLLAMWAKEEKNLFFTHMVIEDDDETYAIIFDFEENAGFTAALLKR